MVGEGEIHFEDEAEVGRALRAQLPRHPAPARLRVALVEALGPRPRRAWAAVWLAPAASALAMGLVMLLWIAPSLPAPGAADPLRPLAHAVINDHARTIWWGESRADVGPTLLRTMEESGVLLNWLFTGDDNLQLVNAQPTYIEGRRGIELAYQDVEGHTVTYTAVPAPGVVLPERGRVQIDRWRPLIRTENGFSMILWTQQGLLCALTSDLVSERDLGRLKKYFVKVRTSSEPYTVR